MFGNTMKLKSKEGDTKQSEVKVTRPSKCCIAIRQDGTPIAIVKLIGDKLRIVTMKKPSKIEEGLKLPGYSHVPTKQRRLKLDKRCGSVTVEIKLE